MLQRVDGDWIWKVGEISILGDSDYSVNEGIFGPFYSSEAYAHVQFGARDSDEMDKWNQ